MNFFKSEDFKKELDQKPLIWPEGYQLMADIANKKLEKESRTVWGVQNRIANPNNDSPGPYWSTVGALSDIFRNEKLTYEALLINIKKLENE